jgi:uncharacterized membrane protein
VEALLIHLRLLQEKLGFINGLFRGLSSPAEVYLPLHYPENTHTALEQMRSDWERIGGDFKTVISREYGEIASEERESEIWAHYSHHVGAMAGPPSSTCRTRKFDQLIPGGADRLLRMAEQEQSHRLSCEREGLSAAIRSHSRGQYLGAVIAVVAIVAAAANSLFGGAPAVSIVLVGVPVLGVVQALIHGKRHEKKGEQSKRRD